jgi:hypothetical protein
MKRAVVAEMLRWSDAASSVFWRPASRASRLGIAASRPATGATRGRSCAITVKQNRPSKHTACTGPEYLGSDRKYFIFYLLFYLLVRGQLNQTGQSSACTALQLLYPAQIMADA